MSLTIAEMGASRADIFAADEVWQRLEKLLGAEQYDEFYAWLSHEAGGIAIDRFYVYTRGGGRKVYSVPVAETGLDLILVYRPLPEHPVEWGWVVENVVEHSKNPLAQMSPFQAAVLKLLGPWVSK